jgi:hypothetical protein
MLFSGDKAAQLAGGYNVMPTAGRGLYEELMPGFKTKQGIVPSATDPTSGVYQRTEDESKLRMTGFRSLKEAKEKDLDYQGKKIDRDYAERRAQVAKKVRNNIVMGSTANLESNLKTFYELGGDPNNLLTGIDAEFFNRHSTKFTKMVKAAESGSYPKVEELIRYLKAHGYVQ